MKTHIFLINNFFRVAVVCILFLFVTSGIFADVAYYNFSNTTDNKAYKQTVGGSSPPTWSNGWAGTEANATDYSNLNSDNGLYGDTPNPTGSNQEPYWRFNFTIHEDINTINWIYMKFNGLENAGESGSCYVANFTAKGWGLIGSIPTSDNNLIKNFTTASEINRTLDNVSRQFVIMCQGVNFDGNDYVKADFVEVRVAYTIISACYTFAIGYPAGQTFATFETTDTSGASNQTEINATGQTQTIPFYTYDNQCASGTQTWSMKMDGNLNTSKFRHKVSQNYNGWQASCSGDTTTGCANVETTTDVVINNSISNIGTSDAKVWAWADHIDVFPSDATNKTLTSTSS